MSQLDPQAKALLDQIAAADTPAPETPAEVREGYRSTQSLAGPPDPVFRVEDKTFPGPAGEVPVRVYTPRDQDGLPILVYLHGGSFVSGDLDTHDAPLRALTNRTGCITVAVGYRLAPEHPFPAALEDAYAVVSWLAQHASDIGGDGSRLAVGGDSAGGNLAAVTALLARDRGGPALVYQMLLYPNTDATLSSESWREFDGYILTRSGMASSFEQYLLADVDAKDPRVSPLFAPTLAGLPPALIVTGGFDPLRDEGEVCAKRLEYAGVAVTYTQYEGMVHGFFQMAGVLDATNRVTEEITGTLRAAFGEPTGPYEQERWEASA